MVETCLNAWRATVSASRSRSLRIAWTNTEASHESRASRFEAPRSWDTLPRGAVDPNSDIFGSYIFLATLQLRTPVAVLEHHGKRQPGPPAELPKYCEQKDGRWSPIMKSWAEVASPRAATWSSSFFRI